MWTAWKHKLDKDRCLLAVLTLLGPPLICFLSFPSFLHVKWFIQHLHLHLQMKDMRHENVNPFMGFFHDCGVFAIVTEFCSRGSLEDLLHNDDVKLDWMFKSSLLMDLIKVVLSIRQKMTYVWEKDYKLRQRRSRVTWCKTLCLDRGVFILI